MTRRLRRLTTWSVALTSWTAVWIAVPGAQAPAAKNPGKANWLTDGGDNQRTAWQKNETLISKDSVKNMKLLWKLQFDNQPRQMHNLFPPLLVSDVTTAQGAKDIAVVAGVSDNIYGVDIATGTRLWSRKFDSTFVEQPGGRGGGVLCPGGLTATPVIAPTDTPGRYIVYAVSWDGRLRTLDVATGTDAAPAGVVPAAKRQAVRAEPLEGRHLHHHRPGLRRQSERVLRLRPGDEESRSVPCPAAAACGRAPARRLARTARSTPGPATATTIPNARSTASRSSA